MNYLKNIENNKTKIIGLLAILLVFWIVLYFIPEIFVSLFNTVLGNIILLIIVVLVSLKNYKYGIILGLIFLIIFRFKVLSKEKEKEKEGFTWTAKSTRDFIDVQDTINPKVIFDVEMIQKNQASQQEVDYFNEHEMWPWTEEVKLLYEEAVSNNPYIRNSVKDEVNNARKKYNQAAILRVLSYQSNEGRFLISGVQVRDPNGNEKEDLPSGFGSFGYESGLIGNLYNDVIKCNSSSNNSKLERIKYTGKGGIYGEQTKEVTDVDYNDLENIIPGFSFLNGPCNPCGALNEKADYSCRFRLNVEDKPLAF
jgi:hypothetical protein